MNDCLWIDNIIKQELFPTMGCTDPAAIALATAGATGLVKIDNPIDRLNNIESIQIKLDCNIYKNAHSARIPKLKLAGINWAILLGAYVSNINYSLEIFEELKNEDIKKVQPFYYKVPITIDINYKKKNIFIKLFIHWKDGSTTAALIENYHNSIKKLWKNNRLVFKDNKDIQKEEKDDENFSITKILKSIDDLSTETKQLLSKAIEINEKAATFIPETDELGLEITKHLESTEFSQAKIKVMKGTYNRMKGYPIEIYACGGSGNHGITIAIGLKNSWNIIENDKSLLQGFAIAIVFLHFLKKETGVLTPICGCAFSSALALGFALTWGWGGNNKEILQCLNLISNTIGGIICDGAKPSCAYKTGLGVEIAIESAYRAIKGISIPEGDGIACNNFDEFFDMAHKLHFDAMKNFDSALIQYMNNK